MNRGFEGRSRGHLKTLARGREGTGRKEISLGRGGDPASSGPGGGKDPWTEGAVSLGVINITDLCNLTHFRSPSATTTRSIFLPFLLLKPVHPTAFPLSFFSPRPFSIATQRVCVHLHHDHHLPSFPPCPSDNKDPPPGPPKGGGRTHLLLFMGKIGYFYREYTIDWK